MRTVPVPILICAYSHHRFAVLAFTEHRKERLLAELVASGFRWATFAISHCVRLLSDLQY